MNILEKFKPIKNFVFDVDGVLTNGNVIVLGEGKLVRQMNIKDGFALQLAIKKGYNVAIISGGNSIEVKERLNKLGVTNTYFGVVNKKETLLDYIIKNNLQWEETLFMGDDIPDYNPMKMVGLACCPKDAVWEIKQIAHFISSKNGGQGCVREVIEKVLKLNNNWDLDSDISSK